jgi:hypothetical protein
VKPWIYIFFGAFFCPQDGQKNRAIRSNLFYRKAVKKDFRSYPVRRPAANIRP